jgi:hypothetical protein
VVWWCGVVWWRREDWCTEGWRKSWSNESVVVAQSWSNEEVVVPQKLVQREVVVAREDCCNEWWEKWRLWR